MFNFIPPGPVCSRYIADRSRTSCIVGPFGSGKTRGALVKLYLLALQQIPTDGVAASRFIVSRLTRPQLTSTVVKSFHEAFPEKSGFAPVESAALRTRWRFQPPGFGHIVDVDWQFLALETDEDIARILGLEATSIFIDEARLIDPALLGKLAGRLRYPAVSRHYSLELASNPWDTSHPLHERFVLNQNEDTAFFHQPGGLDKDAAGNLIGENLQNLNQSPESRLLPWNDPVRLARGAKYYEAMLADPNLSPEEARLIVHSKFGVSREGKPVYSDFNFDMHVKPLKYDRALPLEFGHDFGLSSATAIYQQTVEGQLRVLAEFVTEDQGDIAHFERLRAFVAREFQGYRLGRFTGDPAGLQRGSDGHDKFAIARRYFNTAQPANNNETARRVDAVNTQFRRQVRNWPALTIDSTRCPMLVKACVDKYFYKRVKGTGEQHSEVPEKNRWSHIAEALAYACLGAGCGRISVMTGDVPGRSAAPEGDAFAKACAARNPTDMRSYLFKDGPERQGGGGQNFDPRWGFGDL